MPGRVTDHHIVGKLLIKKRLVPFVCSPQCQTAWESLITLLQDRQTEDKANETN